MTSKPIQFKHRNLLRIFVFVLLGLVLLVFGLIGYFTSQNFIYFYLVAAANIILAYIFFTSRIRKDQVVFDPVFVKYKLNEDSSKKIKATLIDKALLNEDCLEVQLTNKDNLTIDLKEYSKQDQVYFEKLLNSFTKN